ncbi:MAG TPA: DUF5985 family protein [Burkholderiales bacterium]
MISVDVTLSALAVLASVACMVFLFRAYAASRVRLLLWSGLCFVFLSLNNMLLFTDRVTPPDMDLRVWRLGAALIGVLFLLYGFIWESE